MKARSIIELIYSPWSDNLREVTAEQIEQLHGVGPKTSRFFVMCHKPESRHAALDTHILKWLKEQGVPNVPKSTPSSTNN